MRNHQFLFLMLLKWRCNAIWINIVNDTVWKAHLTLMQRPKSDFIMTSARLYLVVIAGCLLCKRDSKVRKNKDIKKDWPERETLIAGQKNIICVALVNLKIESFYHYKKKNSVWWKILFKQWIIMTEVSFILRVSFQDQLVKNQGRNICWTAFKITKDSDFERNLIESGKAEWVSFQNILESFPG